MRTAEDRSADGTADHQNKGAVLRTGRSRLVFPVFLSGNMNACRRNRTGRPGDLFSAVHTVNGVFADPFLHTGGFFGDILADCLTGIMQDDILIADGDICSIFLPNILVAVNVAVICLMPVF